MRTVVLRVSSVDIKESWQNFEEAHNIKNTFKKNTKMVSAYFTVQTFVLLLLNNNGKIVRIVEEIKAMDEV